MTFRDDLGSSRPLFGAWLQTDSVFGAEAVCSLGYDWAAIDRQHGLIDYRSALAIIQSATSSGTQPIVRVSANSHSEIGRALDAGAVGVIVPQVESASDAMLAVSACRYYPAGTRSWGPTRARLRQPQYAPADAERDAACILTIESAEAVENIAEIVATPGVDAIYLGTSDLAVSMGLPASLRISHPQVSAAVDKVISAAAAKGLVVGGHPPGPEDIGEYLQMGLTMLAVYRDIPLIQSVGARLLQHARKHVTEVSGSDPTRGGGRHE